MDRLFIYNLIHLAGVMGLFTALGSLITIDKDGSRKLGSILHGVSLFLILLGGFGMLARLGFGVGEWWIIIKLVIWLFMGASLVLAKKKVIPAGAMYGIILLAGITAAFLGIYGKHL